MLTYTLFGTIEVEEQTIWDKRDKKVIRPVVARCGISAHSYTRGVERAVTDFGADVSFSRVAEKMKEHYGIDVPISGCRTATLKHAAASERQMLPEIPANKAALLIGEADGSMVPIVSYPEAVEGEDRRKKKTLLWKEAKLTLVRREGEASTNVAATLGDAKACGKQWRDLADASGFGKKTRFHGLGDGAPWIADQVEQHFGKQGSYLIDLYHVCEYLAPVAALVGEGGAAKEWVGIQKARLLNNDWKLVLADLQPLTAANDDPQSPAHNCDRYLRNRSQCLNYRDAIASNLPVGSGEVESAHRSVIQARLKCPGAWWLADNAQFMLNLESLRHNGQWENYWSAKKAA